MTQILTSKYLVFDFMQVKGVTALNQLSSMPLRCADEWRYSSTHSQTWHYGDMSGQIHATVALHPKKQSPAPVDRRLVGGPWSQSERCGIELRFLGLALLVAHRSTDLAIPTVSMCRWEIIKIDLKILSQRGLNSSGSEQVPKADIMNIAMYLRMSYFLNS